MKKNFLYIFVIVFLLLLNNILFADATANPSFARQGDELTVMIETNEDMDRPVTGGDNIFSPSAVIPGCSVSDVEWHSTRQLSCKIKVLDNIDIGEKEGWITLKKNGEKTTFKFIIKPKLRIIDCVPKADYQRSSATITLYGEFEEGVKTYFNISGVSITFTPTNNTCVKLNMDFTSGTPGGPYTISFLTEKGESGNSSDSGVGFILYPKPTIDGVDKDNFYQTQKDVSLTIKGTGFDASSAVEFCKSGGNEIANGVMASLQNVSENQIILSMTIDKDSYLGDIDIKVINPDGQRSRNNLYTLENAIKIVKKLTPIPIIDDSDKEKEQGFIGSIILKSKTDDGEGFDNIKNISKNDIVFSGSGVNIINVVQENNDILNIYVEIEPTASTGTRKINVTNPIYNTNGVWDFNIIESKYSKLDKAVVTISTTSIHQGTTIPISIDITNEASFEKNLEISISGKGLNLISNFRKSSTTLELELFADKNSQWLGKHKIYIKNPNYNSTLILDFEVLTNIYNNPIIIPKSEVLYKNDIKNLTIFGEGFDNDAVFSTINSNITIQTIQIVSSTEAIITVSVSNEVEKGKYNLIVKNIAFNVTYIAQDYFEIKEKHSLTSISPNMIAPDKKYNFFINGINFYRDSKFLILIDGKKVNHSLESTLDYDPTNEIVIISSNCVSNNQISCVIYVGSNVVSGLHDVGVYFENTDSTQTLTGVMNIPNKPVITNIANTVSQGDTNKDIVINGLNFEIGASVVISGSGIIISTINVISENNITIRCDVTESAEKTDREVKIINPTGLYSTGILKVIAPPIIESCSPGSVMQGIERYLEIKGSNFNKNFKLSFSGKNELNGDLSYIDISTYTNQKEVIERLGEGYIYILKAICTGTTQITAIVYIGKDVGVGQHDIIVTNYLDVNKSIVESKGVGTGLLDVRTPLAITKVNGESIITVPVGYDRKTIMIEGSGFSENSKISISGTGVNILTDNTNFVNTTHIDIVISVEDNATQGLRVLTIKDSDNSVSSACIQVIPSISITKVEPSIMPLGCNNATMTITGSIFNIDYDPLTGELGVGAIDIIGGGISNIRLDTTTYNSNFIRLYCKVDDDAFIGSRDIRITNKDGENSILKENAFYINENVKIIAFTPQSYQVSSSEKEKEFRISGENFAIKDENNIQFINNDNLECTEIINKTNLEIWGKFKWKNEDIENLGNRNVDIKIINDDGSIGTLQNALLLTDPLAITSINPSIIPINAKDFLVKVKGKGFLENPEIYFFDDNNISIRNNIKINKIKYISSSELELYINTSNNLSESSDIKLRIKNVTDDAIITDPKIIKIESYLAPIIHNINPNSVRVGGIIDSVIINGYNFSNVNNVKFSNGIVFTTKSITNTSIEGSIKTLNSYIGNAIVTLSTSSVSTDIGFINYGKFEVLSAPTINSISQNVFYEGISSALTIFGKNFDNGLILTIKEVNGANSIVIPSTSMNVSNNTIQIFNLSLNITGTYAIEIKNPDNSNVKLDNAINVYSTSFSPVIDNMTPSYGKPGETSKQILLTGMNFLENDTYIDTKGGIVISTYTCYTTSATFVMNIPETISLGSYTITLNNLHAKKTDIDFYIVDFPVISLVSPKNITRGATTKITIQGSNFLYSGREYGSNVEYINPFISGTGVNIIPETLSYKGSSELEIDVYVEKDAVLGSRDVIITNPFSMSGTGVNLLNVTAPIKIYSISPTKISQGSKQKKIVINGSGFKEGIEASFTGEGIIVTSTTYISETQIALIVNVNASAKLGYRGIKLTNPNELSETIVDVLEIVPKIIISKVNPSQVPRGIENKIIEIIGNNFSDIGNEVIISGTGISIGEVINLSQTTLKVPINISADATLGKRNISIINTESMEAIGDGVLEIVDGIIISSISPSEFKKNLSSGKIIVKGSGFKENLTAKFSDNNINVSKINFINSSEVEIEFSWNQNVIDLGKKDLKIINHDNTFGELKGAIDIIDELSIFDYTNILAKGVENGIVKLHGQGFTSNTKIISNDSSIIIGDIVFISRNDIYFKVMIPNGYASDKVDFNVRNLNGDEYLIDINIEKLPVVSSVIPSILGQGANTILKLKGNNLQYINENDLNNLKFTGTDISVINIKKSDTNPDTELEVLVKVSESANIGKKSFTIKAPISIGEGDKINIIQDILTIVSPPEVIKIFPNSLTPNATYILTIEGSGFNDDTILKFTTRDTDVTLFDYNYLNSDKFTVKMFVSNNAIAGTYDVKVINKDNSYTENYGLLTILPMPQEPKITEISPSQLNFGVKNKCINIIGSGFDEKFFPLFSGNEITISSYNWVSNTHVQLLVSVSFPENAVDGYRKLTIVNESGRAGSSDNLFSLVTLPIVESMSPESIGQGSNLTVYLNGKGFTDTSDVSIEVTDPQDIKITTHNVIGNKQLTFDVKVGKNANIGAHDIKVKTRNGSGIGEGIFIVDPFLSLEKIEPSKIVSGKNQQKIYIYGTGFKKDSKLDILGIGITIDKLTYKNEKLLEAIVSISENATLGARKVTISNSSKNSVDRTDLFSIIAPIITNVRVSNTKIDFENPVNSDDKDKTKIDFYFDLNENCKSVELCVLYSTMEYSYNSAYVVARLSSYLQQGSEKKLTWDGHYSLTELDKKINGKYRYIIRATLVNSEEFYHFGGDELLEVDVVNITNLNFSKDDNNKAVPYKIEYFASKACKVEITIKSNDNKDNKRTINKDCNQGEDSISWNGTLNDGSLAPKGGYKIEISGKDSTGDISILRTLFISIDSYAFIDSFITEPINNDKGIGKISFIPLSSQNINIDIYRPNTKIVKIDDKKVLQDKNGNVPILIKTFSCNTTAGTTYTVSWDGKDNRGDILPDGLYVVVLTDKERTIIDTSPEYQTLSINRNFDIFMRREMFKKYFYPYPNPVYTKKQNYVNINYLMSKKGAVSLYIYDVLGNLINKKYSTILEGYNKITWNLDSKNGKQIGRGIYILILEGREDDTGEILKATKKMMVIK